MTLLTIKEECQTFSLPNYVDVHPLYVEYENNIKFDYSLDLANVNGYKQFCQQLYSSIMPKGKTVYKSYDKIRIVELIIGNLIKGFTLNKTVSIKLRSNVYSRLISYRSFGCSFLV